MKKRLAKLWRNKSLMRVLSGWFAILSAGAVGLVIFTPNFIPLGGILGVVALTYDITFAILFLFIAVKFDERSKK